MAFLPFDRMWDQVEIARQDSDTSLFLNLLYFGEMLLKLTAAGLISAVQDDRDRHRYRQLHRLVRANGVGDWGNAIDDVLSGPASQHLVAAARKEQKELTQNCTKEAWQYEAVRLLTICLREIDPGAESIPTRVAARRWFASFAELRNKTRGHGVPQGSTCGRLAPALERSIRLIVENLFLFKRPWAYLHRNLSGKYRVTKLADDSTPFEHLKSTTTVHFENGVYVHLDEHRRVELVASDPEASDFFYPNGAFNGKHFETMSYLTGTRLRADAGPYLLPASELPASYTEGIGRLEIQGNTFGNLPPIQEGYIDRTELESELSQRVLDDRHAVITLAGSGGIGKTSLALAVLHRVAETERYGALLWFSARDIDLLLEGPKMVQARVLTETEIAHEFVELMEPSDAAEPGFKATKYLADALTKSPIDSPLLFVFDNFETVRNPSELFAWIDTYIRLPNKVLITTRVRDFKGDYPVEVFGMSEPECHRLITETAFSLGIRRWLTDDYRQELIRESDGHPYVIKILLGEVAKLGKLQKVERIVSGRTEVLDALFERTYATLSPAAKQVFLTLSNWRSLVPQLAAEAVMLRPGNERFDVEAAIEELRRSSLVESSQSKEKHVFLSVPLVAAIFAKRKLTVSPLKSAIEANTEILRFLGAAQKTDVQHGIGPRLRTMFGHLAGRIAKEKQRLAEYLPIMEFVAQKYPPAWLLLARLHEESGLDTGVNQAKQAIIRYLQESPTSDEQRPVWRQLAQLCVRTEDWTGEIHALVEMCELPDTRFVDITNAANRLNSLLYHHQFMALDDKRVLAGRLVELMASRIQEGDATDCSRLAWLYLHLRDEQRASEIADLGLRLEPHNHHCLKIKQRLAAIIQ